MSEALQRQVTAFGLLLELTRRAREAESAGQLGFVVVNETRQLASFRQSAVWLAAKGLTAVSGLPAAESNPYGQWLEALCRHLNESLAQGRPLMPLAGELPDELARDWADWLPASLLILPWRDARKQLVGAWLLAREEPWPAGEVALLQEISGAYAHAWQAFLPRDDWRARARRWLGESRRKRLALAAAALTLCLLPVRLTVLAPAEVLAKDPFLVRVPLEGVVDQFHVQPNQPVQVGQPLFDLDTTGLRSRLSVAQKSYEAAKEEYRQSAQLAVTGDEKSRLEMPQRQNRMDEKAEELAYSEQLMARVQVKASRAGVAVFANASDWIGRSLAIGERVMQIADPGKVEVSIRLPVADAIDLPADAAVTLYLTTAPQVSYRASLRYAAYQAEPGADGVVAYPLRAALDTDETPPRLGLTGTAKLYGHWVPLVYYVMRRPLAAARQRIGW